MLNLLSHPRFLAVYSGALTIVFVATISLDVACGRFSLMSASAAEKHEPRHSEFDQLTVHRINIVEPDGTPRLIISDKAEFPGGFFEGKELGRPDRSEAGMLFMNDEGTENGGMLFGGYRSSNGKVNSFGHLSFDDYEQDQTLSMDSNQEDNSHSVSYQINDNASAVLLTPEVLNAFSIVKAMPDGPEKKKALAHLRERYPVKLPPRASLERDPDQSAVLRLCDPQGHSRILLRVAADGTPTMQFLDASGKVTQQWPETPSTRKN